jgi:hypothetical protein
MMGRKGLWCGISLSSGRLIWCAYRRINFKACLGVWLEAYGEAIMWTSCLLGLMGLPEVFCYSGINIVWRK